MSWIVIYTSSLLLLHALTQASLAYQTFSVPLCRLLSVCSMCTDTKSNWCCGMERVWLVRLKTSIYTTVYNCECMRLTLVSDIYTNHIKELATFTQLWLHHKLFSLAKYLPMTFELKMQSLDCCLGCKTSFCSRHVTLHCVCSDADLWWETE